MKAYENASIGNKSLYNSEKAPSSTSTTSGTHNQTVCFYKFVNKYLDKV